ncbi:MAG: hypothetical protein GY868_12525, partial [Deltaproteobacteria bacterium]|nr:hypothetical protein [Deltaproteobacteria bacterium]
LKTLLVFAAGCLAVSQGLDFIEGLTTAIGPVHPVAALENQTARHFTMVLEEFLEMFGITLLLTALLRHLRCITAATDNSARE